MKFIRFTVLTFVTATLMAFSVSAQETQTRVVDEVVAQVNDGVITLSRIKREMKSAVDSFVQEGKSKEEAQKLVDEKQGELIAGLINEELLVQKAKEGGLDSEIEAELNRRFVDIMKQYNLKTIDELYQAMEKQSIDPKELRDSWRKQATRDKVVQKEIQQAIYWKATPKELKEYFDKHKDKFTKPETISFSEVFFGFAGRDEKEVREKAKKAYESLKGGADFAKIAKENDTGVITQGTGKAEKLEVKNLVETLSKPLSPLKTGEFTPPFDVEDMGVAILRVDDREKATSDSVFDENAVRMAILNEKFPEEQKKFMTKLRDDSYIKISDSYRPIVSPILFADERKTKPTE